MKVAHRNFLSKCAFLAITVLLIVGFTSTGALAMAGTPASQVDVYYVNNGTNFLRSASPMNQPDGGGSVSQTANPDGSIVTSLTNVTGYGDSGFGVDAGRLGDLNGLLIKGTGANFGLNLYFDKDGNGEYFTWSSNTYTGTGSDAYILGAGSTGGFIEVTNSTLFTSMNPGGGNYTLGQLKSGSAAGITATTNVRLWIGVCCNGTMSSTINLVNISSGPISDYYVDDGFSAGNADDHIFGVDAFASIQDAVNAAGAGAKIHVAAGTYTEQVTLNKSLQILGAGAGSSIISAPATLPAATLPTSAIVLVSGSGVGVELTGFTITGPGPSGCGSIRAGIYVYGDAFANIHDNTIQDIRDNPFGGCQNGIAIAVGRQAWSTSGTATIDHNTITGYQKGGIVVDNAGSSATITDNTLTGAGTTNVTAQNGIQISRGADATLSGNTVNGNSYHKADAWDWGATGILLYDAGNVTLAGGNTISGNDQNLYVSGADALSVGAEILGPSSAPIDFGYDVVNFTSLPLDLTSVTFPGAANNFAIEDRIWHGVDDPNYGLVTWVPGNLFVTPSSGTIQNAIDLASLGDTVNVAAGTYDEQVVINNGITLTGVGVTTVIQPTQTTADNFILYNRKFGGPLNTAGVIVTDTPQIVTVSNLKVDGSLVTNVPAGADAFTGILFRGNPGTIDNVTVADIHHAGGATGLGMYLSGFDTPVSMTVSNSTISGYEKNGITASYANLDATLSGNTITGMGPTSTIAQNGIQFGSGSTGTVTNNTISDHVWTGTYGGTNDPAMDDEADGASGVLLYMAGVGVEIDNNTLTGNQFGIWSVAAASVNIHDNTITGLVHSGNVYPTAIAIWSEDMWTFDFGGTETGTAAVIASNTISTNDYGVIVRDFTAGGPVPSAILTGNTFSNNTTQVIATGDSLFATAATLLGNTFDRSVTVYHTSGLLPAIWSKIQLGIDTASGGDTVNIGPGTYPENVIVDQSVTLAGNGANSTIVQPAVSNPDCGAPGLGSLCAGASNVILVQANNVVIHDLTVDGDNPALTSAFNIGGANIDARNGIITNHGTGLVYNNLLIYNVQVRNIYLRGIYASSGGSFNIHDNTVANVKGENQSIAIFAFGGTGNISGNFVTDANDAIAANWSNGIQFINNNVTLSATGIHTDNAGDGAGSVADLIQGNTISNCTTDGYGIFVFVPYIGPTVDDNTITGCSVGLSAFGQYNPVTTQFTNNTVTGPDQAANSVGAYITTDLVSWGYEDVSVLFTNNVITNFETGVVLTADVQPLDPVWVSKTINAAFHLNQIYGNTDGMTEGTTGVYVTDFEKNWWGAASGPGPVGLGTGDTIAANVDYSPWCTNPECTTFAPPIDTTTTITSDTPDPSVPGQTVSVTVTVASAFGGDFDPTGSVTVFEGIAPAPSGQMGSQAVGTYCTVTLVNGTGSCDLTFLTSGTKTLTALYSPESTTDFTASSDTESHTVDKVTSVVNVWPTASDITYGQTLADSTLSGGSSTPAGTFAFTTPSTMPNAGTASQSVTFTPTDSINYSTVTGSVILTVNKAALSVTANNVSKIYDGAVYSGGYSVSYAGFVNSETASVLGSALNFGGASQSAVNAGSYPIVPSGLTSANYDITFNNGTLTINKASQAITFGPLADKTFGDADFTVTATASSTLPVTFTSSTLSVCTVTTGGLVHLAGEGICTITAHQAGDTNFEAAADLTQSFHVGTPTNHAPVITQGAFVNVSMSEDGSPNPFALTLDATDADGDTLTWSVITAAAHGTASASGTGSSKVISYTPAAGYVGSDNFEVQVSDGKGGTDSITVFVTVEPLIFKLYLPLIFR